MQLYGKATSAVIGGTIVNNGGDPITLSGVVFSTSSLPTISGAGVIDSVTTPNISSGSFNFTLAGLTHSTKYYYRAYATNAVGTASEQHIVPKTVLLHLQ